MRAALVFLTWMLVLGFLIAMAIAIEGVAAHEPILFVGGGIALLLLGILLVVVFLGFLLSRNQGPRESHKVGHLQTEEARTVQEIYASLARMEERIEALETILLDRPRGAGGANVSESREGTGRGVR